MTSFADGLAQVRAGRLSFSGFVVQTKPNWYRIADYLIRRWNAGGACSSDDVVQDLLLAAWDFIPRWEEERGVPLEKYVVWNSCDKAKKRMHQLRGVKSKHADRVKTPRHVSFEVQEDDDNPGYRQMANKLGYQPHFESVAMILRHFPAQGTRERSVVCALIECEGDIEVTEALISNDSKYRFVCDFRTKAEASRFIQATLEKIAHHLRNSDRKSA